MENEQKKMGETRLYQQATFTILAKHELIRAQRYPSPITLLHISINLGEAEFEYAERLKRQFAEILNSSLRVADIPSYYGDDYLVLMPVTDEAGGRVVAQRLITRLKGTQDLDDDKSFKYNIHVGIAAHPGGEGLTLEELLGQAAQALSQAKKKDMHAFVAFSDLAS